MIETQRTHSLADQVRSLVEQQKITLPPLPEVGVKILTALEDDRTDANDVARLIQHEPAVAATVLRTANSAAFGGLQSITDLSQAIPRLGMKQVGSIVTALVHKGHFHTESPEKAALLRILWDHAVATAMTARHISGMCGGDPEQAFLAGLLHDVGKLLVLKGIDHLEQSPDTVHITPTVLSELMTELHAELGQKTLREWKFPEPICEVARRHHEEKTGPEEALLLRVQAANAIARKVADHLDPQPDLRLDEITAVEHLGLNDLELASLLVDLEDELAKAKKLF